MSTNQPSFATPEATPPKRGMSTGAKVALILGSIFGVLVVACCGLFIAFVVFVSKSVSKNPKDAIAVSEKIGNVSLPPAFRPAASIDVKVPIVGKRLFSAVSYADQKDNSNLILAAFGESMAAQNQEQMKQQLQQSFQGQSGSQNKGFVPKDSETKELSVLGKPALFKFIHGEDPTSHAARVQVVGTFDGRAGLSMFIFEGDATKYDDEAITKIIESIK